MELIKEINLNINQPNNFELINIMQGSVNSVKVIAHLYDGNQPYQIPDTVSEYQLLGILPSGKYLIDDKLSKYDSNSVSFFITKNMMAKAGYIPFSISLVETGDTAIAETFPAKIMVTAIPGQDYEQTDEIPIITETLQQVKRNAESAAQSAQEAKTSETNAKTYEINAGTSEQNSKTYADNAKSSETKAKQSETNAMNSETNAANSMAAAAASDDNAAKSAVSASTSAATATTKATEASDYANHSKSYAVGGTDTRENEDIDNSKFYYEQSKAISESLSGALRPMGTVTFANLPSLEDAAAGDMYNIADQFTTDENFKEGSGLTISAGSNVYKTADGKWDVLAGCPVTGVKGNSESTYRKGNVNLTADDIGLGNVGNFKAVSTAASQGLSDTEKANARSNIGSAPTSHASTATTYGASSATNYGHATASSTTPKANGTAAVGTETAKFARGDHVHPAQTSVSGSSGSCTGNAATATKLATARTLRTNLASTSTASFDGTANITPGVTGTLPVANGGTGKTTLTSDQVLVGNGTSAVSQRAIDTTVGGTAGSTSLITSGAVKAGLDSCARTIKSGNVTSSNVTFSIDSTKNYLLLAKGGTYDGVAFIITGSLISVKNSLFLLNGTTVTVVFPSSSISYKVIQL